MCLGDWKTHGSEYYECSRYKENPDIVNQSQQAQAREALKKYLFYFERVGDISLARAAVAFQCSLPGAKVIASNLRARNCPKRICAEFSSPVVFHSESCPESSI